MSVLCTEKRTFKPPSRYSSSFATHHDGVLHLHGDRATDNDGNESQDRAQGQGRKPRDALTDGAAHGEHAAKTHQDRANEVVDEEIGRASCRERVLQVV